MTKDKATRIVEMGTEIRDTASDHDECLEMIACLASMFMPAGSTIEQRTPTYQRVFDITEQYYEAIMRSVNDPEKFDPVSRKLRALAEHTAPTGKGN